MSDSACEVKVFQRLRLRERGSGTREFTITVIRTCEEQQMPWFTVIYPNRPDAKFDFDYYRHHHVPLAALRLGYHMEILRGVNSPDGAAPPYLYMSRIWVDDATAF